jgi:Ala-tRNA(Pro) deacylase
MPVAKLREFLDTNHIPYTTITHSAAFTAQGIAALTHIPGKELAKTVIVNVDDTLAMAVLPASLHVDLDLMKHVTGAKSVAIAHERDFQNCFPGCELGAMPPFGNLYDLPVYVDESLSHDKEIAFNAGSHYELIRMSYEDFAKLVKPVVARLARMKYVAAA